MKQPKRPSQVGPSRTTSRDVDRGAEDEGDSGPSSYSGSDLEHPFRRHTNATWDEIRARVLAMCMRCLSRYPNLDPEDAANEVVVQMLRRDFGKHFNRDLRGFWTYLAGVASNICKRSIREAFRLRQVESDERALRTCDGREPSHDVALLEFVEDLHSVQSMSSPAEVRALSVIREIASGSTTAYQESTACSYLSVCRAKAKLRSVLTRHWSKH